MENFPEQKPASKARILTKILMILFQFFGTLGMALWMIIAISTVGHDFSDGLIIRIYAFIQFICTIGSYLAWIPFKQQKYLLAVLLSFASVLSVIIVTKLYSDTIVYN